VNATVTAPPSVEPLRLGIELEPDLLAGRKRRNWRLCLTVPKSHDGRGKFLLDLGCGDVRSIMLSKLSLGPQTYTVDPIVTEFGAKWVSPEVHPKYRSAVEARIAGLETDRINVFTAERQKKKPLTDSFCWGGSYYFVWQTTATTVFPPGLLGRALAENSGWSCSLAILPYAPDPELSQWIADHCNLPVIRPKREWAIAYPPPYAFDDNGSLEMPPASSVFLALKSIASQRAGELTGTSGQAAAVVQLDNATSHIVELTDAKGQAGKYTYVTWDNAHVVTLVSRNIPEAQNEPAVTLEFDSDGKKLSTALHRSQARQLLKSVRCSKARLTKLHAHPALRGHLRHRQVGALEWNNEALTFMAANVSNPHKAPASPEAIERITQLLQNFSLDVELDFGAFGRFVDFGFETIHTQAVTPQMPRELRSRLEWLCKSSGAFVTQKREKVGTLEDEALVRHFQQVNVPLRLMPHKRALEAALRFVSTGGAAQ
jgi:hypothetical protein